MIWTIDTWILVRASEIQDKTPECKGFLFNVLKNHTMAVNEETIREYNKSALKESSSFASKWYGKMWSTKRVRPYYGPEDENAKGLRRTLKTGL